MGISSKTKRFRPMLETMDDRIVPATLIDLTTAGSEGTVQGAIVKQTDNQVGGTSPFLRIKDNGVEEGYNTNARPNQLDAKGNRTITHALKLSTVPTVVIDGVTYREFRLNAQEKTKSPFLSVDELRFYISSSKFLTGYNSANKTLGGKSAIWDMDAGQNVTIKLDSRLNQNSGKSDMVLLVPNSVFAGHPAPRFLYLYSKFGGQNPASGAFEQWAVRKINGNPPPPPVELGSLSGFVYLDALGTNEGVYDPENGDMPLAGVQMILTGTDDQGQSVFKTAITGFDGSYSFIDLRPGLYSILQSQEPRHPFDNPAGLVDGALNVGSLNGKAESTFEYKPEDISTYDRFFEISIGFGQHGIGYNFGEVEGAST